jgi:hypothetical protein
VEYNYLLKERVAIMKKTFSLLTILVMAIIISLSQAVTINAQETGYIEVARAAISRAVVDREPIDIRDSFDSWVGTLYCFTKITGAQNPIEITHVWYFGDTERARVSLLVRSSSWRTHSSKKIQTHEIGDWHVDILGPDGEVLRSLQFRITP